MSKVGAEGVHSALLPERGWELALKVEDGNSRAQYPALLRLAGAGRASGNPPGKIG